MEQPSETGLDGEVALPLWPWTSARLERLARRLGGMVVISAGPPVGRTRQVMDDLTAQGCLVREIAGGGTNPHPLLLAGRLLNSVVLEHRAEYLRIVGVLPGERSYLLRYARLPTSETWAESAAKMAGGADLEAVDVHSDVAPIDLLTVVAESQLVVTDSPGLLALAVGLGRPAQGVVPPGSDGVEQLEALAGSDLTTAPEHLLEQGGLRPQLEEEAERRGALLRGADLFFDALSVDLSNSGAQHSPQNVPTRIADLADQVAALGAVNAGLRLRLAREREAMATYVRSLRQARLSDEIHVVERRQETEAEIRRLHEEIERLRAEIVSIYGTRTLRLLRPAREVYSRLRARPR